MVKEPRYNIGEFYKTEWGLSTRTAYILARSWPNLPLRFLEMSEEELLAIRNFGRGRLKEFQTAIAGKTTEELLTNLGQYGLTE